MGVRYRRNMCECLGGRPGPWGGMPRMLCAPAGDLARWLDMWSLNFLRVESVAATKVKRHSVMVWCGPGRTPRSVRGPRRLNRAPGSVPGSRSARSADIAHPLPPRGRGSRPARSLRAGARPARSRQTDRPGSPPARVRTSVPRRGFAMRTGSHTPTLEPCTPACGTFQPDPKSIATEGRPPWRALDAPWRS